ncbi:MAG: hypothetical protein MUF64_08685 [Polyangiaceae bacterium]|nr:hypothetical protein [Polyangiaceae bacterium]
MSHRSRRAALLVLASAALAAGACEKKKQAPPSNQYQAGSIIINLPPSVQIPAPQGRQDAPTVGLQKCNFVVDRQITFMTQAKPHLRGAAVEIKPNLMQECMSKWTQEQYDCMVASRSFEEMVYCKRFQRP